MESGGIMSKYHIRTDGSIGVCRAKEGKCPYTTHIEADTIEQAQIEADAVAYNNWKEELKQRFGDNVTTIDAYIDSDGIGKLVREQLPSCDNIIGNDVDNFRETLRKQLYSTGGVDGIIIKSLHPEELENRIKKDTNELETMLKSDMPELNRSLDINNYKQKG